MARFRVLGSQYVVFERDDGVELMRSPELRGTIACRANIIAIRLNALLDQAYARSEARGNRVSFTLLAVDGTTLAVSRCFPTPRALELAIDTVRREASRAYVVNVESEAETRTSSPEDTRPETSDTARGTEPRE